jgi:hypothetical protein
VALPTRSTVLPTYDASAVCGYSPSVSLALNGCACGCRGSGRKASGETTPGRRGSGRRRRIRGRSTSTAPRSPRPIRSPTLISSLECSPTTICAGTATCGSVRAFACAFLLDSFRRLGICGRQDGGRARQSRDDGMRLSLRRRRSAAAVLHLGADSPARRLPRLQYHRRHVRSVAGDSRNLSGHGFCARLRRHSGAAPAANSAAPFRVHSRWCRDVVCCAWCRFEARRRRSSSTSRQRSTPRCSCLRSSPARSRWSKQAIVRILFSCTTEAPLA